MSFALGTVPQHSNLVLERLRNVDPSMENVKKQTLDLGNPGKDTPAQAHPQYSHYRQCMPGV